jgi:hypothetical protein
MDIFLFEEGELAEEKFSSFVSSGDPLAWGVANIGDFFKG